MPTALMPELTTYKGYRIPAGWKLRFGDYSVDPAREAHYIAKLLPVHKYDEQAARLDARQRIQDLAGGEEMRRIQEFVMRCADDYARRFSDLRNPNKTLAGFDPEALTDFYLPGRKSPGRDGLPALKNAMLDMAKKARTDMYDDKEAA